MEELKALAQKTVESTPTDETRLPQVHALNSLRETFKSSILGTLARSYTTECLQLAADCLDSDT